MHKNRKCLWNRQKALIFLQSKYDDWQCVHTKNMPRNGLPVGGGDWMDSFFKLEGIRGMQNSLRQGSGLTEALEQGKTLSEIAIRIWNQRREYQVHRWEKCCHSFLECVVKQIKQL